jgi:UDP-N-acetylmuramoyl-tripeptide--D-alanyl-D-alanine ligase
MTFHVSLAQLLTLLNATPIHLGDPQRQSATGINTDTRILQPGELFVALRGDSFDGHRFVEAAIAAGAVAAIVDQPLTAPVPQLVVSHTLHAYQTIGRWWREQFAVPVIAITGSVGKTTTKEMIAAALETAGPTLKTEANFNNEIGVPKTLLNLKAHHRFAVIEMGMRGPGEIAELAAIAKPDIGVITNVGTAHIGRLGSREAIAQAKCELLGHMPASSLAILNAENPLLLETAQGMWSGQTITYGLSAGDLRGTVADGDTLIVDGIRYPLPLPGEHNALNLLAVISILRSLGIDDQPLKQGLTVNLPTGRAQRYTLPNDIVLLDETYNAGVESMVAALKLLAQTPGKRKIAVLGPMKELGDYTETLHQEVGQQAAALQVDALYILDTGPEGTAIAQGAGVIPTQQFDTHAALVSQLLEDMQPGDRLLFKASHAIGLDRVVHELRDRLET